jgi:polysaccharide biosynthesis transport protein
VVIDGPSLQEAPEARLLASWADHVLLAVHCGTTNRETAQTTLHQLARTEHLNTAQTTRFSSVLTRADPAQQDKLGRRAEQALKSSWATLNQWWKAAFAWSATGTAALNLKRSVSPRSKSRN